MYYKSLFTCLVMLLSSCFTPQTSLGYEQAMNSWIGSDIQEVMNRWGYPDREFKTPYGRTVYEWITKDVHNVPARAYTTHNFNTKKDEVSVSGGYSKYLECKTWVEVDQKKVMKITFHGNWCLAVEGAVEAKEQAKAEAIAEVALEAAIASGEDECNQKGGKWGRRLYVGPVACRDDALNEIPVAADAKIQAAELKLKEAKSRVP